MALWWEWFRCVQALRPACARRWTLKQILVQAYSFTSPAIAKALADAKASGVDIEVILDKSQWTEKYSGATYLANHKIPVLIDDKHAIAHNKVMIIDDNTVIICPKLVGSR
jgi:phosphatidylserine/phosphatidylglycerophosphate/cardiolipin synthase-like enzyme